MKIPGYQLHRKIGSGGMAAVYLATQHAFNRKVAIKIIANSRFDSEESVERFKREAKIIAGLSHPHIVPVYDVGSIGDYQYLAMEYLPGGELSTLIKAGLEPLECVEILKQVARALHFAHGKGYIHRDVKPDNIMFREDLSAVLTDFGIARPKNDNVSMTQQGKVVGTPIYMSPEQSQNKAIDGRADIYALGVIFFEMLTRQLPYQSDDAFALAVQHIQEPIPKLPTHLHDYQHFIDKLMAKDACRRFQSGLELVKALDAFAIETKKTNQKQSPDSNKNFAENATTETTELSLADIQTPANSTNNLQTKHVLQRKFGVIKRYALHCNIRSDEHQHFAILFSQLTTKIMAWHQQRARQCGDLQISCQIKPEMIEQVEKLIANLQTQDSHYAFLKNKKIIVVLLNSQGDKL